MTPLTSRACAKDSSLVPFRVNCACGKKLSVPARLAGKRVKCPGCDEPLSVPYKAASPCIASADPGAQQAEVEFNRRLREKKQAGWLQGCGALIFGGFMCWIAMGAPGCDPTAPAPMSESYKAGHQLGLREGYVAYNLGRRRATDDDLDEASRRITGRMTFDASDGRSDWIQGYEDGYRDGWDAAKK